MPRLPPVSDAEALRAFERLGFRRVSQDGSHVKVRRGQVTLIVPLHRELKKGTLAGIIRQSRVSSTAFLAALSQ